MLGLSILLLLGVLDWDDCLSEMSTCDTLAWFAVLMGMASQLTSLGIVTWMSGFVAKFLMSFSLSWPAAFGVLQASYFFIHYLFASQTGHVAALYYAFLAIHLVVGVPGVLAALALAYNTNLFGSITHYSSGQAAVYYGDLASPSSPSIPRSGAFQALPSDFCLLESETGNLNASVFRDLWTKLDGAEGYVSLCVIPGRCLTSHLRPIPRQAINSTRLARCLLESQAESFPAVTFAI